MQCVLNGQWTLSAMTSKSKNGGYSGGRLCRKLLKRKYFATLKVNNSVSICFETYKVSNCVLLCL